MTMKFIKVLTNILKSKNNDVLVFQISESSLEACVMRKVNENTHDSGINSSCMADILYTKKILRVKPIQRSFTDIEVAMRTLIDHVVRSGKLSDAKFCIADARIICMFTEPLSKKALTTYTATLKRNTKITKGVLMQILQKGGILKDETQQIPKEYALYYERFFNIELNGYNTNRPINKIAKRVHITLEKYFITPELWGATGAVLEQTFHREITYMHKSNEVELLNNPELCNEIYTDDVLQELAHDIL